MNPAELFISAHSLPESKTLGRIAINEENVPGILLKIKKIENTNIYIGIDLAKGTEWVSLKPMILNSNISLHAAAELYYVLRDIERNKIRAKLDISMSSPISTEDMMVDLKDMQWSKFSFDENTSPSDIKDFLNKLFGPSTSEDCSPPYNDNDFKIDNEDEDLHNN